MKPEYKSGLQTLREHDGFFCFPKKERNAITRSTLPFFFSFLCQIFSIYSMQSGSVLLDLINSFYSFFYFYVQEDYKLLFQSFRQGVINYAVTWMSFGDSFEGFGWVTAGQGRGREVTRWSRIKQRYATSCYREKKTWVQELFKKGCRVKELSEENEASVVEGLAWRLRYRECGLWAWDFHKGRPDYRLRSLLQHSEHLSCC